MAKKKDKPGQAMRDIVGFNPGAVHKHQKVASVLRYGGKMPLVELCRRSGISADGIDRVFELVPVRKTGKCPVMVELAAEVSW